MSRPPRPTAGGRHRTSCGAVLAAHSDRGRGIVMTTACEKKGPIFIPRCTRLSGLRETLSRSDQATNPAARRIAIPHDTLVDVETMRFRLVSGQLNLGHHLAVSRIQLVNGAIIGLDAPQDAIIPSQTV